MPTKRRMHRVSCYPTIEQATEKLRKETQIEHLYFFKGKRQVARFEGTANQVAPSKQQMLWANNALILHNHLRGHSMSVEDVANAVTYNAAEIRVITHQYVFMLKRPGLAWGFKFLLKEDGQIEKDQETSWQFEESVTTIEHMLWRLEAMGEIHTTEKTLLENHYIWQEFFKLKNIYYERWAFR